MPDDRFVQECITFQNNFSEISSQNTAAAAAPWSRVVGFGHRDLLQFLFVNTEVLA